ncbi:type 1 pili tip component [Oleiphilus sp. HI0009]|uniref:type 1 pili tip component n=2 Tax=Oleiphilus TaxID=141450 RepID=UPI0007C3EAD6|nr:MULTISPECIES: type 1 pili tip component [unclassified Oleiphilus]KZX75085.1 type 1 pili tip component [Oleiphilus sp. HI0009]MCH2158711.1 type 1 pili tip component [Oleiphilaceae bacterium]KZY70075.1 type 1 pili tip component [Oleiphilus sp. HI0067]KZY71731.1 type 1 pili tip component [Oleiphilus sp. HI0066]KZZ59288.1 type 1 pili tip component [Oleiphilus sp. HI0125]
MRIKELTAQWEKQAKAIMTENEYSFRIPIEDAAKIEALAEMYPKRNKNEILCELISSALQELETAMPYIAGTEVAAIDEQGDPLYQDVGPTPRFLDLSKKHCTLLKQAGKKAANG